MDEREDFVLYVSGLFDILKKQFLEKNQQYGTIDPLANFSKGAQLLYGSANYGAMFRTAMDYEAKHLAHVLNKGIAGDKVDESLRDIAIYSLIEIYLVHKYNNQQEDTDEKI